MCNHAAKPSALSTPNISRPDIAVGEAFDPQTRNANSIMSTLYCVYNKIKNSFIYYFQETIISKHGTPERPLSLSEEKLYWNLSVIFTEGWCLWFKFDHFNWLLVSLWFPFFFSPLLSIFLQLYLALYISNHIKIQHMVLTSWDPASSYQEDGFPALYISLRLNKDLFHPRSSNQKLRYPAST